MFKNNKKGFSMVEIVLAIVLSVVFFLAIYEIILFSNKAIAITLRKVEAIHFAQEGVEAVRLMRNNSWATNIDVVPNNTTHYIIMVGDQWILTLVQPSMLNDTYTRTIIFNEVQRDANGDIVASGGVVDTKTRKVISSVSWSEKGVPYSSKLEIYITNILSN